MKRRRKKLDKPVPRGLKARGEWVELLFMAEAARRALKVSKPQQETRYDAIVDQPRRPKRTSAPEGRFWRIGPYRVQVKSTLSLRKACYECLCTWASSKWHGTRAYSDEHIDFVAAYIIPEDTWFIIPAKAIPGKMLYLPPRDYIKPNRLRQFREAWHLLGVDERGLTIYASAENDLLLEMIRAKLLASVSPPRAQKAPRGKTTTKARRRGLKRVWTSAAKAGR
jgi:hypothetical protein